MYAGGSVTSIEHVREVTKGNCKELEKYVQNQEGKIPIFGYPLMTFNRPNNQHSLTDKKTWRIATLNNGEITKIENPSELSNVSDKMA